MIRLLAVAVLLVSSALAQGLEVRAFDFDPAVLPKFCSCLAPSDGTRALMVFLQSPSTAAMNYMVELILSDGTTLVKRMRRDTASPYTGFSFLIPAGITVVTRRASVIQITEEVTF